jgi:hypothetical protein
MPVLAITKELGRLETFFSDVIYPVWPLWLALFVVGLVVAAFVAYRLGWHRVAAEHRLLSSVSVALILAISVPVGWYTISPLFDRNTVCEASPIPGADSGSDKCDDVAVAATMPPSRAPTDAPASATTAAPTNAPSAAPAFEPTVVRQGDWVSADDFHFTNGKALLIETEPGKYTLRVEEFSVRNGPDVFVLLSPSNGYQDDALNLGGLKGTDGAFNYEIPEGTDISKYVSAIIWCRQFDVLFGHAELN